MLVHCPRCPNIYDDGKRYSACPHLEIPPNAGEEITFLSLTLKGEPVAHVVLKVLQGNGSVREEQFVFQHVKPEIMLAIAVANRGRLGAVLSGGHAT